MYKVKVVREISNKFLSCDECNCEIQKEKDAVNKLILSDGYKPLHICDRCFEELNRCVFSTLENKNKQGD